MTNEELYSEYMRKLHVATFSSRRQPPHADSVLDLIAKARAVGKAEGYAQGLEDAAKECALLFDAGQSGLYGNGCLDCAAAIRALHRAE